MRNRNVSETMPMAIAIAPARPDRRSWQAGLSLLLASWQARRQRARDVAALAAFTDYELRDLSLSRVDVHAIADGTFRRETDR
jgi:uncharacterized protein YjiS (DUF1127 family)